VIPLISDLWENFCILVQIGWKKYKKVKAFLEAF